MTDDQDRFAGFVATLGRGPGRSRALTRDEAREAFTLLLAGRADPHQVGAFLMLLRYRGEDADEITGIVEAMQGSMQTAALTGCAALDWPSYGAGRTRGAPWFLLAALALARSGVPVLMHGTNAFSSGTGVPEALAALAIAPAADANEAACLLRTTGFAYLPLDRLAPAINQLLMLRRLFGLRSPVNTAVRLIDPARAPAGIDGVFHPLYIEVHLGVAERLGRERTLVLKGGGGEAERNPTRPITAYLQARGEGRRELVLPPVIDRGVTDTEATLADFCAVWSGEAKPPYAIATILATLSAALLVTDATVSPEEAMAAADVIWAARERARR